MRSIDPRLIVQKNKLYSTQPWIMLFELDFDDGTYLRLAAYPDDVTWNGHVWTGFPLWVDASTEDSSGALSELQVHVANQDRTVSAYLENTDLAGKQVTLYIVHNEHLDVTDVPAYTYRISAIVTTDEVATFTLGHERLLVLKLPRQRFIRNKCRFRYKDSRCRYPNSYFDSVEKMDFKSAGDIQTWSWRAKNMAHATRCNIDIDYPDQLVIQSDSENGVYTAWDNTFTAPYIYKTFTGDIDAYCDIAFVIGRDGKYGGMFFIMDDGAPSKWFAIRRCTSGDSVVHTIAGSSTIVAESYQMPYWRLVFDGKQASVYHGSPGNWILLDSRLRADIADTIRIGFCAFNTVQGTSVAQRWSAFYVTSGGLATCDLTLEGPNGCRAHNNTRNFGGFPAIPEGRIYL